MRFNPQPERKIEWGDFTHAAQQDKDTAKKLEETLLQGLIPDFIPQGGGGWGGASFLIRQICTAFRMWAYINQEFSNNLARAMESEFGPNATYLEIMAGMGWLAKGLMQADLKGIYIATDAYPPDDAVFPVSSIDAAEAVKKHKNDIDAFVISWPPYDSPAIEYCIEQIPSGKKIIYIGEGRGGCCGTDRFFEMVSDLRWPDTLPFELAADSLFSWGGINDRLYLVEKN